MQNLANATHIITRALAAARAALDARPAAALSYRIHVPGLGTIGEYATHADAESALHYLPYSARQAATICSTGAASH